MILEVFWEKLPSEGGTGGAEATSLSTGILQSQLHHPRGGIFTYI